MFYNTTGREVREQTKYNNNTILYCSLLLVNDNIAYLYSRVFYDRLIYRFLDHVNRDDCVPVYILLRVIKMRLISKLATVGVPI